MITHKQKLRQELLHYFDMLPDSLLGEVLLFIKFLLFRTKQPETIPNTPHDEAQNPLDSLVGMFDSGVTDTAENHDLYLVHQFEQEQSA
ncbi:hypothetical protein QUF63_12675 [Anaerolineales bacterium HSG25]|nr:hypothetical protein [Anaerolineales bacterium HSG25]